MKSMKIYSNTIYSLFFIFYYSQHRRREAHSSPAHSSGPPAGGKGKTRTRPKKKLVTGGGRLDSIPLVACGLSVSCAITKGNPRNPMIGWISRGLPFVIPTVREKGLGEYFPRFR